MLDILFRFSVLNTAFSVIGKEIREKLCGNGGNTQSALLIWILIYGLSQLWLKPATGFELSTTSAGLFLLSTGYMRFVEQFAPKSKLLALTDWKCLRTIAKLTTQISLPLVFWFYIWSPLHSGTSMAVGFTTGKASSPYTTQVAAAVLFFSLTAYLFMSAPRGVQADRSSSKDAETPARRLRPPSARIQARKMEQQTRTRSSKQ